MVHGAMFSLMAPGVLAAVLAEPFDGGQAAAPKPPVATSSGDKLVIPFSDPSRPGTLRVNLTTGTIKVSSHQGKDVLISAKGEERERDGDDRDRSGMRWIRNTSGGLTVEEERNEMRVSSNPNRAVTLDILVPARTSLVLSTVNDGDIVVQGVEGDLEVNNTNGAVMLKDVAGAVVAHALNEDVTVSLVRTSAKPMSFSSLNGDINVTLPSTVKANVRLEPGNGEVYSDFDIEMLAPVLKQEGGNRQGGGKYVLKVDQQMVGRINGGGPEITFKTFNGDIRIRKGA